jgi:raffinose/stachyose/melibiose transport system permease protein
MKYVFSNKRAIALFVVPTLLVYITIVLVPVVISGYYSTLQWDGIGDSIQIGLKNYKQLFGDERFLNSVKNSTLFAIISIFIQLPISLILALILSSHVKGEKIYRTVYFIPVVISTVVIGQLWTKIYNADYGLLNTFLETIGRTDWTQDWLGQKSTALICAFIPSLWQYTGYHMLLMYAGAQSISKDVYEAAQIDGATKIQVAMRITIPLIKPVLKVCMTFSLIGALKVFDLIYVLTNGGPFFSTEVPSTYMYTTIFDSYQYGYGSAMSVFIIMECLIFTLLINKLFKTE